MMTDNNHLRMKNPVAKPGFYEHADARFVKAGGSARGSGFLFVLHILSVILIENFSF